MATLFQRTSPMMSIEKHRTLARKLVGKALMMQADTI